MIRVWVSLHKILSCKDLYDEWVGEIVIKEKNDTIGNTYYINLYGVNILDAYMDICIEAVKTSSKNTLETTLDFYCNFKYIGDNLRYRAVPWAKNGFIKKDGCPVTCQQKWRYLLQLLTKFDKMYINNNNMNIDLIRQYLGHHNVKQLSTRNLIFFDE